MRCTPYLDNLKQPLPFPVFQSFKIRNNEHATWTMVTCCTRMPCSNPVLKASAKCFLITGFLSQGKSGKGKSLAILDMIAACERPLTCVQVSPFSWPSAIVEYTTAFKYLFLFSFSTFSPFTLGRGMPTFSTFSALGITFSTNAFRRAGSFGSFRGTLEANLVNSGFWWDTCQGEYLLVVYPVPSPVRQDVWPLFEPSGNLTTLYFQVSTDMGFCLCKRIIAKGRHGMSALLTNEVTFTTINKPSANCNQYNPIHH